MLITLKKKVIRKLPLIEAIMGKDEEGCVISQKGTIDWAECSSSWVVTSLDEDDNGFSETVFSCFELDAWNFHSVLHCEPSHYNQVMTHTCFELCGPIDKRDNILANGNMVVWRIWVQVSIQHFFQVLYSYIGDMWRSQFNVLFLYLKVLQSLQVLVYDGCKHIKHSNAYSFLDAQTISEVKWRWLWQVSCKGSITSNNLFITSIILQTKLGFIPLADGNVINVVDGFHMLILTIK